MSVQTISYNFEDLRNLPAEKLVESIPLDQAIQVTLEIYKTSQVSQYETYHSWATTLFRRYGPSNVNGSDLNQLFEMFLSAIREILDEYQSSECDAANTKIISFLNYSLELFNWIRTEAGAFCSNTITTFICFGLSLVNNCLVIGHKKLLEKCLALHTVILTILSENTKTFCFDDDHDSFISLITHLCDVGELAPKLDIKTAVDTWKSITKISSQNISQAQNIRGLLNDNAWLRRPMLFLLNEICRNVKTVYNQNSLTEPVKNIEKYLKVTNFYLRLMQKLTVDFEHVLFPVCEDFLKALTVIISPPVFIIHTPVHKVVTSLITKGFKEIIPYAYKNDLFFELLLTKTIEDSNISKAFYEISFEVLEQIIQRNEVDLLKIQLLDVAFERISSNPLILSDSTYNRFIELVSALQVHCRLKEVEEILVKNILQEDIILALTAIDVWCISFRVSEQNTRLLYFQFWRKINESFATFSNQIAAIYVETLLSSLYDILTTQEKVEVWNNFNTLTLNNDRFMTVISLKAIPIDSTKQSTIQHFIVELMRFLRECSNNMTVDNFYTIVKNIKLLTPIAFRNDDLISMLLEYFCVAVKSEQLFLLVESILDFITAKLEFIDDAKVLTVLTTLSGELSSLTSNSMKFSLIRFLKRVSKLPRLEKHSQEMLKTFNSDELVTIFESKELIGTNEINLEENKDFLQQFIEHNSTAKVKSVHICKILNEYSVKAAENTDCETEVLLETIENNVNKLQYLTQTKQQCVSQTTIRTIERVVHKLQSIGTLS